MVISENIELGSWTIAKSRISYQVEAVKNNNFNEHSSLTFNDFAPYDLCNEFLKIHKR